ncbi:MAG: hypothetical protein R6U94_06650 [Nitriliruptoraceae bacterium]
MLAVPTTVSEADLDGLLVGPLVGLLVGPPVGLLVGPPAGTATGMSTGSASTVPMIVDGAHGAREA